ncbi:hypothetical protein B0J11DRAFT_509599 [Dendryphion nanum]|uniref:Uncharacterized protein n=1 Tax=Dendryphion nanum TaxID=256645 RepID=A0A9P9IFX1_9PLEO|nr:hypothetical protein B0J11DRAFT_509599 [Dendryphion nanum]
MDPFNVIAISGLILKTSLDLADISARNMLKVFRLFSMYGFPGILLDVFGSEMTWRLEAQILGQVQDDDASAFRDYVQSECNMISVAAAIMAQIAVTALSLASIGDVLWAARGLLVLSLTCALMAVYYATTQQRTIGRLLHASQIRSWIRGGTNYLDDQRIVPSARQYMKGEFITPFASRLIRSNYRYDEERQYPKELGQLFDHLESNHPVIRYILKTTMFRPSEPKDFNPHHSSVTTLKRDLRRQCFTPSVASVISLSAPQILLSTSLISLIIALGIYLGSTWLRNPVGGANRYADRNVFITFLVGLGTCVLVYSISRIIQDRDHRGVSKILDDYIDDWVRKNIDIVHGWGFEAPDLGDGRLYFTAIAPRH